MPEGADRPCVSVIIPCRNEVLHVEKCLADALAFDPPAGGYEVIVADGMSLDGTRERIAAVAARDPRIRLVDNPAGTTPHALNVGVAAALGEFIMRLDAHTTYAQDYLVQCLTVIEETGADNVGGPALTRAFSLTQRAIAAAYHSRFAVGGALFHRPDYEGPADTVPYGCWRREVFERIGLFDEELVRNQDDEHNYRILKAGGRIWQSPRIKSWYTPRASLATLFKQYFQYGYWKVRVIQKHRALASWRHLIPGVFVAALVILALVSAFLPAARLALLFLLGSYFACVIVASFTTGLQEGITLFPVLIPTFGCYHLGYGTGFLAGVLDFVVLRRRGRFMKSTR